MSDKDLEYKRMTKVQEEYKNTENLSYLYWSIIIAFPIFVRLSWGKCWNINCSNPIKHPIKD